MAHINTITVSSSLIVSTSSFAGHITSKIIAIFSSANLLLLVILLIISSSLLTTTALL